MRLTYIPALQRYEAPCSYEERMAPREAGFRWDGSRKVWYTTDALAAAKLATYADKAAETQLAAASRMATSSSIATLSDLDHEQLQTALRLKGYLAGGAPEPYPYQLAGAALLSQRGSGILGDDMGLGKTPQSLLLAEEILRHNPHATILICCPTAVGPNWVREANRWIGREAHLIVGTKTPTLPVSGLIIAPYSVVGAKAVMEALAQRHFHLLVCDEVHYLKTPSTQRTIAVWQTLRAKAQRVVALSGTPIPNRPREIAHIVCALTNAFGNEYKFLTRYCDPQQVWTGRKTVTTFDGATNVEELAQRLRTSGVLIRRMKTEVLRELPAKRRSIVVLGDKEQNIKRVLDAGLDLDEIRAAIGSPDAPAFTEASQIRHAEAVDRIPEMAEWIDDRLLGSLDPMVVFCHHRDVVVGLRDALKAAGVTAIIAHGGMSAVERQAAVDQFAASTDCWVFIGTIGACGTGLNGLQKRATSVVMAEASWVPGENEQAEDRVCRIGAVAADSIPVTYLVSDGGVDAYVLDVVLRKQATIQAILAEANGIDDAEQIIAPDIAPPKAKPVQGPPVSDADKKVIQYAAMGLWQATAVDGCLTRNQMGYNKLDASFGKSIAYADRLSHNAARAAAKMLLKYTNTQLSAQEAEVIRRICGLTK